MNPDLIVTSDLHIGSKRFHEDMLYRFLKSLPDGVPLVLNGDVLHRISSDSMVESQRKAVNAIIDESNRRRVIWLDGNHDKKLALPNPGKIERMDSFLHRGTICIMHGCDFIPFRFVLRLIVIAVIRPLGLGGGKDDILAARYGRTMPVIYRYLSRGAMKKAIAYARRRGYSTIICGHSHAWGDVTRNGVRYINTGTWTTEPAYCAVVTGTNAVLKRIWPEPEQLP